MEESLPAGAQLPWWHSVRWEEKWQGCEHSCGMLHWFDRKGTIRQYEYQLIMIRQNETWKNVSKY